MRNVGAAATGLSEQTKHLLSSTDPLPENLSMEEVADVIAAC
jgi:hypothetical protein